MNRDRHQTSTSGDIALMDGHKRKRATTIADPSMSKFNSEFSHTQNGTHTFASPPSSHSHLNPHSMTVLSSPHSLSSSSSLDYDDDIIGSANSNWLSDYSVGSRPVSGSTSSNSTSSSTSTASTPGSQLRQYVPQHQPSHTTSMTDSPAGRIFKKVCMMTTPIMMAQALRQRTQQLSVAPSQTSFLTPTPTAPSSNELHTPSPSSDQHLGLPRGSQRSRSNSLSNILESRFVGRTFVQAKRSGHSKSPNPDLRNSNMKNSSLTNKETHTPVIPTTASMDISMSPAIAHHSLTSANNVLPSVSFVTPSQLPSHPHFHPLIDHTCDPSPPFPVAPTRHHAKRPLMEGTPQGMEPRTVGFRESQENKHKRLKDPTQRPLQTHSQLFDQPASADTNGHSTASPSSSSCSSSSSLLPETATSPLSRLAGRQSPTTRHNSTPVLGMSSVPSMADDNNLDSASPPTISAYGLSSRHLGWKNAVDSLSHFMDSVHLAPTDFQAAADQPVYEDTENSIYDSYIPTFVTSDAPNLHVRSYSGSLDNLSPRITIDGVPSEANQSQRPSSASAFKSAHRRLEIRPSSASGINSTRPMTRTLSGSQQARGQMKRLQREYASNQTDADDDQLSNDLINRKRRDPNAMSIQTESSESSSNSDADDSDDDGDNDDGDSNRLRLPPDYSPHRVSLSPSLISLTSSALFPPSPIVSPLGGELPSTGLFTSVVKFAQARQALVNSTTPSPIHHNCTDVSENDTSAHTQQDNQTTTYFDWPSTK